jgi:hypothetical protein
MGGLGALAVVVVVRAREGKKVWHGRGGAMGCTGGKEERKPAHE